MVYLIVRGVETRIRDSPGCPSMRPITLSLWLVLLTALSLSAADDRPEMTPKRTDVKPFEYIPANVPFYPPGKKWGVIGDGIKRMQRPLDVAESMKHYVHPVGFEL